MELDMYSEERSVAREYDGPQHYEYPNGCHETRQEYEAQRERDRSKDRKCAARVRIRFGQDKSVDVGGGAGGAEREAADQFGLLNFTVGSDTPE
jgi:hypothetical protein